MAPSPASRLPPVSVIIPVRNPAASLSATLRAVLAQRYAGAVEVVVADGSDGAATAAMIARRFPQVRVVRNPLQTTPAGLNRALAATTHGIVARCDAQAIWPPDYLAVAVATLERTGAANVGGRQRPVGRTRFERAVALATTSFLGTGGPRYRMDGPEGPADTVYLGVFRRDALEAAGGFDEAFIRNQDYELNWRLRARGETVWFTPALASDYRPRGTVRSLARQYFEYGWWKRAMLRRHPASLRARQGALPALVLALALAALALGTGGLLAMAGIAVPSLWFIGAGAAPVGYALTLLAGAVAIGAARRDRHAWLLPLVLAVIHLSWGSGFWLSRQR